MSSEPLKIYWFDGDQVQGPVSGIELRELAFRRMVTPQTQVQIEGQGRWIDAAQAAWAVRLGRIRLASSGGNAEVPAGVASAP